MAIEQSKIDELKAAHGDNLYTLECGTFEGVFRGPDPIAWKKLRAEAENPATEYVCDQNFVVTCLVYPSHEQLAQHAQRTPAIYQRLSVELGKLAGARAGVVVKKL